MIVFLMTVGAAAPVAALQAPLPPTLGPSARTTWAARTAQNVTLDGVDDEPAWAAATMHGDFRQFEPEPDAEPSHPTEFRVLYDADDRYTDRRRPS